MTILQCTKKIRGIVGRYRRRIEQQIKDKNEKRFLTSLRRRNKNERCSIICNNCIGGVIYHNLGMEFDSPTINLFFNGDEYLEFCKFLEYYSTCELITSPDNMKDGYPIGILVPKDDSHIPVSIYFQHYKSFEEAKEKWIERFKRVDFNNLYFIWDFADTQYDPALIYEFDKLPLKHKLIITHRKFPDLKHAVPVSCYIDDKPVAKILMYRGLSGKRYLDEVDYVSFLNSD